MILSSGTPVCGVAFHPDSIEIEFLTKPFLSTWMGCTYKFMLAAYVLRPLLQNRVLYKFLLVWLSKPAPPATVVETYLSMAWPLRQCCAFV